MKKPIALFLTILLIIGMGSTYAFADTVATPAVTQVETPSPSSSQQGQSVSQPEPSSSEESSAPQPPPPTFVGGHAILPTTLPLPAQMEIGDTVNFIISYSNFADPEAANTFDLSKLTAIVTPSNYFASPVFTRNASGIYLTLTAQTAGVPQEYSVSISESVSGVTSSAYAFTLELVEPQTPVATPSTTTPSSSSSSSSSEVVVPSSSSQQPSSSSSTSSDANSSESSASSSSENASSTESPDVEDEPEDEDIPYTPPKKDDIRRFRSMSVPYVPGSPVPGAENSFAPNGGQINKQGPQWQPFSGIPDIPSGATISNSTSIIFAIAPDAIATSGTTQTRAANIATLNTSTTYTSLVEVLDGATHYESYFDISFIEIPAIGGLGYGVRLTPKSTVDGLTLAAHTAFGFKDAAKYLLPHSLTIVANSTSGTHVEDISAGAELGGAYTWVSKNGSHYTDPLNTIDDAKQGDEFLIHFDPQFFIWTNGKVPSKVTLSNIRNKVSLRRTNSKHSQIFEEISLTSSKGEAVVRVKFKDHFPLTHSVDFSTLLSLTVSGKTNTDSQLQIDGVFADIEPIEFYSEDKEIDISNGEIGRAYESISLPKVYIGEGVTLNLVGLRKGVKFCGTASLNDTTDFDDELLIKYPDILQVYGLYTIGLNGAGTTVNLEETGNMFIYDADFKYLGQIPKKLPFSEKYYLSSKLLELETEVKDDELDDEPPINIDDLKPPANANANPFTGR